MHVIGIAERVGEKSIEINIASFFPNLMKPVNAQFWEISSECGTGENWGKWKPTAL